MINLENNQISFVLITLAYWFFMLTDGALRMIVLLHFHILGFTPLQLAYLFLLYEFLGMITNLSAGWIAKRFGLNKTLFAGIILQILSLLILSQVNQSWNIPYLVTFVMFTQGLSGIAKDLTKMSAKSSVKLLSPDQNSKLFKWVSLLTGSKNAIKGLGFLFGALLLSYTSFYISLVIMAILLSTIFIIVLLSLNTDIGSINKKSNFTDIFSKNKNINYLSLGRVFLFGSRDAWFVVALPIFLYSALSDGSLEGNKKAFFIIGSFMAAWTIFYGFIQTITPKILIKDKLFSTQIKIWAGLLCLIPILLVALNYYLKEYSVYNVMFLLFIFGFVFAINSSLHSFLILQYTDKERVSLDVGFYYMSNAFGRLTGTLLSGLCFELGGFTLCLLVAAILLFINRVSMEKLDLKNIKT